MRKNWWEGDADDVRLGELSAGYSRLKGYQRVGVRWLLGLAELGFGGILADEMGLGKTAQALTFFDLLSRLGNSGRGEAELPVKPSLVVVPASLMDTWEAEARSWCPHFRVFRYYASSAADRVVLASEYMAEHQGKCRIVLTTPAVLHNKEDRAHFFRRVHFDYLVCDEAHGLKNAGASRFRDVQRGVHVCRRLLITGTPVQNSLRELGNLLALLLSVPQERQGGAQQEELRKVARKALDDLEVVVDKGSLRTLQVRAAPFIMRRLKRDVMKELPPKLGHTRRCQLAPAQRALYERELELARARARAGPPGRGGRDFVRSLFHRLRRICNHPLLGQARFGEEDYALLAGALRGVRPDFRRAAPQRALEEVRGWSDFDAIMAVRDYGLANQLGARRERFEAAQQDLVEGSAKVKELLQLLGEQREAGRKTLVFSQFTQFLDVIGEALVGAGFAYARLDGSVNVNARPQLVHDFQRAGSGVDVFLLSTKAGGTGLNLTAADRVVLMDLSFNPHDNRQAEDRAHRLGQQRPVDVHYLVCAGTVEEAVLRANHRKMELDYQFGGQRILLQAGAQEDALAQVAVSAAAEEEEEEDEEEGAAGGAQEGKRVEQEVLDELESVCAMLPAGRTG